MVIGFIGLGNMANAIIGGIVRNAVAAPEDIVGASATLETERRIHEEYGIRTESSNIAVAKEADILILAVKPGVMPIVIEEIRDVVNENQLIISVAAGKTTKWLGEQFDKPVKVVRCMPNTPALVGEGCSAVCRNKNVSDEELGQAMRIFESFGSAEVVKESLMDTFSAVAGSSPAFVFMLIEALADAGVKGGLPRKQAYRFAAQSVMGSGKLMLETGRHPGELKDMVCSPGGTTIEGVETLEMGGFRGLIMDAVDATIEKTKRL